MPNMHLVFITQLFCVCCDFFTVILMDAYTSLLYLVDDFMPCLDIFWSDKSFVYRSVTIGMTSRDAYGSDYDTVTLV